MPDQAERVTGRIGEDTPAALRVTGIKQCGAEFEDMLLGVVQLLDLQVEVELLGAGGVGPPRWPMSFHALEGEHHPSIVVEGRPAVVERPPRVRLVHHAAEQ